MKKTLSNEVSAEINCPACGGTGFPAIAQPLQPGRKIYPARCKQCHGKGRIETPAAR
jgi:DnaJ-class molecular chaperone